MSLTPEQLAEQAGSTEANRMLDAMRNADTQAVRLLELHECLKDLAASEYADRSMAGFAVAILPYLEQGLGTK